MLPFLRRLTLIRLALLAMVGLGIGVAGLASVSPQFHKHLHHDADEDGHDCLITALAAGSVDSTPVAVFVVQPAEFPVATLITLDGITAPSFFLQCSIHEHAPPALS
jgi:hypothetical protein